MNSKKIFKTVHIKQNPKLKNSNREILKAVKQVIFNI